ncbi:ATP-binding protein [Lutibacter flavus]|uniref:histidine kinase n=1 Tax=Lutibacter flavus TaxID=691689 RepID=A0A238VYQ8_9FLAO|nr:ATP-binding protein [Lutibacter flavus]SNR39442.1 PAS domain S-box-containing protein [Lutibacter flavus]
MNFHQIGILFLQGALVVLLIFFLFRLRKKQGIGLLFACLGLFQFMQVFLSSTIYVEITDNLLVSPGSSVLFTATLFAILIIYIKEEASETRKIIYALLIVNIIMSLLILIFSWSIEEHSTYNPFNVSTVLFDNNAWALFVGGLALFLDSLLIIIIYEFISRHLSTVFFQIFITMLIVVSFDTLFFSIVAFWNFDNLSVIITSGLISKGVFAIFYSILFYLYLKFIETNENGTHYFKIKDVFHTQTYKQKFELARLEAIKTSEEVKLNEAKYRTLTNISPVGVFHTRVDGFTTFVNPRWCEISGLSKDEALGNGWMQAVHPDDIEIIKKGWELATVQKRKSQTQYRFLLKDGTIKWVLGLAVPELNSKNEIIGYVGTITDITDLKIYQQEQIILKEKAEESNRLKSAFLANMSHEIRTPMNGILGFSDLLKNANISNEEQQNYIRIIEKSGTRMLNIINDIINISKIESGLMEIILEEMNINEQIEYIYTFFKPEVEAKGIKFSFKNGLPADESIIKVDREKFISILTNLIKNAIKYSEKGSIEFGYVKKKEFLEFYVKDTGIGIPEERQKAIFERFIQADIEDKMARQGAGLGLAISKAYIELLGGKLWVESKKNQGSNFYFTIPYSNNINEITLTVSAEKEENKFKNLKILIVEDDEISKFLIDTILEEIDCIILHATNGIEAVEMCRNNPDINLILMDIKMPIMDGYEATRQIRKFNKDVIIVAQTAFALTGDDEKSVEAGCNEHLSKPISKQELFSIIQRYFAK